MIRLPGRHSSGWNWPDFSAGATTAPFGRGSERRIRAGTGSCNNRTAVFKSVDEYIAAQPAVVQRILQRVRATIRRAVPEAQETISYNMPTYRLSGDRLLYFAVWKQHYAIYAATAQVLAAFREELRPYEIDKGTIRFPLSAPVPVKLIGRIARFRAKEIAGRG